MIGRRADSSGFSDDLCGDGPREVHGDFPHPSSSGTPPPASDNESGSRERNDDECRPDSTTTPSTRVPTSGMVSTTLNSEHASELLPTLSVGESKEAREPNGSQSAARRIEVTECASWLRRGMLAGTRRGIIRWGDLKAEAQRVHGRSRQVSYIWRRGQWSLVITK
jgi:hypothetical protein